MQKVTVFLFLLNILFNCSSNQDKTDKSPPNDTTSTVSFPVKPLHILSTTEAGFGADIRLSFTENLSNDRATIYKINSIYENKKIGFDLIVPNNGFARLILKSTGANSDNFIHLLAKLYKQKVDTSLKFSDRITGDCINMGEYIDSLNKQDNGQYGTAAQYKVFLKGNDDSKYAEIYMSINEKEHWVELGEKDKEYRPIIIGLLAKK
jgi:hypothetical protein